MQAPKHHESTHSPPPPNPPIDAQEKGALICTDERCLNRATFTECMKCSKGSCANQRLRSVTQSSSLMSMCE